LYILIDFILRLILIGFFALFLIQSISNYNKAKEKGESKAKDYYLAYILFFAFSLINFIQTEIDLQYTNIFQESIYPDFGITTQLGDMPTKTIIFIALFIPSMIPIMFIIENRIFNLKKPYLTIIAIVLLSLLIITIFFPIIAYITIVPIIFGLLIMILSIISIYVKLVLISQDEVRKAATFSLFGWILIALGILIIGGVIFLIYPSADESQVGILTHSISIIGVIFIFYGSRIVRQE